MQSILNPRRAGFVLLVILGLALPTQMIAGKKDYIDAVIIDASFVKHHDVGSVWSGEYAPNQFFIVFQIDDMTYVGRGMGKIKEADWPVNSHMQVRFNVKHVIGLRHTYMHVKATRGEVELELVSKKGPDGKELCGNYRC